MKTLYPTLLFIFYLIIVIVSCQKRDFEPQPEIEKGSITDIRARSARAMGKVVDVGNGTDQHGHCWAQEQEPTIENSKTELGAKSNPGEYISEITGLDPGTIYYVRGYNISGNSVVYSEQSSFTTKDGLPTVGDVSITDTTAVSLTLFSQVTGDGGDEVIAKGFCWDTINPFVFSGAMGTFSDSSTITPQNFNDSYSYNITGLFPGRDYYIKAYAVTSVDTSFGNMLRVKTHEGIPEFSNITISGIKTDEAACRLDVISDNGLPIVSIGFVWSRGQLPSLKENEGLTADKISNTGVYISRLEGLSPGVRYYVRAYATNEFFTTYSDTVSFMSGVGEASVSTRSISNKTSQSATSGGLDITTEGGIILKKGVCWGRSTNPSLQNNLGYTEDGSGTQDFYSSITGLSEGTNYYVRAYVTNEAGTFYGENIPFKTPIFPIADFTASPTKVNVGGTVSFANLSQNATSYSWTFQGGTPLTSTQTNPTVTYNTAGTYDVTLTVLNSDGDDIKTKTGLITVSEQQLPIADFSASSTVIKVGETVSFTNLSQNATSYSWSFQGGTPSISSQTNPTITYNTAGTYYVTLTATNEDDDDIETKTGLITVTEIQLPLADFSASSTEIKEGETVTFSNLSQNATSYSWAFEGGTPSTSTQASPTVTYSSAGTYNVSLTVTNEDGNDSEQKIDYITVLALQPPDADFSASPRVIKEGETVTFTNLSKNATSYSWTFEGGTPSTSTQKNPTVTYSSSGDWDVTLIATNEDGDETELKAEYIIVSELQPPVADFSASSTEIKEGKTVTFSNLSQNATSYSWTFEGGTPSTSTQKNPTVTYSSAGDWDVTLTAINEDGEDTEPKAGYISVSELQPPVAKFWSDKTSAEAGKVITFEDRSTNATGWLWDFGDGTTSTLKDLTHTYSAAGRYTVSLTATNADGSDVDSYYPYIIYESSGTISDYDGNSYSIYTIGSQRWMGENLKVKHYNDGTSIPLVTSASTWASLNTPAYCWYNNNESAYKNTYGALYNVYSINTGKLCPSGWHVPTSDEWLTLYDNMGGSNVAGGKLKETGLTYWNSPNTNASNEVGFSGLPGGYRQYDGVFYNIGNFGNWWSSTQISTENSWYAYLSYNSGIARDGDYDKKGGFSVRCLEGDGAALPVAKFWSDKTRAEVGEVIYFEDRSTNATSLLWDFGDGTTSTLTNPTHTYATAGTYTVSLTATNSAGWDKDSYAPYTISEETEGTVTDSEGNAYNTIKIGEQWWMAENLRTSGGAIYDEDPSNLINYGRLYTWNTAQDICPTGWHLPSIYEWQELGNYLIANGFNYDGSTVGNKIGKSLASSSSWNNSTQIGAIGNDQSSNNSSGFSALPGGYQAINKITGYDYFGIGQRARFWTSSDFWDGIHLIWGVYLNYNSSELDYDYEPDDTSLTNKSIRCIKD